MREEVGSFHSGFPPDSVVDQEELSDSVGSSLNWKDFDQFNMSKLGRLQDTAASGHEIQTFKDDYIEADMSSSRADIEPHAGGSSIEKLFLSRFSLRYLSGHIFLGLPVRRLLFLEGLLRRRSPL